MSNKHRVLYFINGPVPTPEQKEQAKALGASFRNALQVEGNEKPEPCTAVFGEVPSIYSGMPKAVLGVIVETNAPDQPDAPIQPKDPEPTPESPAAKLTKASGKKGK